MTVWMQFPDEKICTLLIPGNWVSIPTGGSLTYVYKYIYITFSYRIACSPATDKCLRQDNQTDFSSGLYD